jgi:hypothetical protein
VTITGTKLISGPKYKKHPGDSEISGKTSNSSGNTQCSSAGLAGSYDCTAEAVTPTSVSLPLFEPAKKGLTITTDGFVGRAAKYSGKSPPKLSCGKAIGSNAAPGGLISADFTGEYSFSTHLLRDAQIVALKVKEALRAEDLTKPHGQGWLADMPMPDDDCLLIGQVAPAICSYDSGRSAPNRSALEIVKRVK